MELSGTHAELPLSAPDIGRRAASRAALLTAKGILAVTLRWENGPQTFGLWRLCRKLESFLTDRRPR